MGRWLLEQPQLEVASTEKVEFGDLVERRIKVAREDGIEACIRLVDEAQRSYDRLGLDALPDDDEDTSVTAHLQRARGDAYDAISSALGKLSKELSALKAKKE